MIEVDFGTAEEFAMEMQTLRRNFPKLAKEIDKCIFDVGQNFADGCGDAKCACSMSLAEFHEKQNLFVRNDGEKL